jgi:hypothetical protein
MGTDELTYSMNSTVGANLKQVDLAAAGIHVHPENHIQPFNPESFATADASFVS